jgi:hypothetical protein
LFLYCLVPKVGEMKAPAPITLADGIWCKFEYKHAVESHSLFGLINIREY